jgi:opacity protein-like surface antigen
MKTVRHKAILIIVAGTLAHQLVATAALAQDDSMNAAAPATASGEPGTPDATESEVVEDGEVLGDAADDSAADPSKPGFARAGVYLGISAAYGINFFDDRIQDLIGIDEVVPLELGSTPGLNARLGARFFKIIALEAEYEWFQGFDVTYVDPLIGRLELGKISNHTLTGNLKLFLPTWRVQPYIMAGAGATWWKAEGEILSRVLGSSGTGFAARAGGGIELYITRQLVFDVEVTAVIMTKDIQTRDIFAQPTTLDRLYYVSTSAGFAYRF